jgi:hypothetical protein
MLREGSRNGFPPRLAQQGQTSAKDNHTWVEKVRNMRKCKSEVDCRFFENTLRCGFRSCKSFREMPRLASAY